MSSKDKGLTTSLNLVPIWSRNGPPRPYTKKLKMGGSFGVWLLLLEAQYT